MRIKEIRIEGLFDMFDHVIPLNQDEHLTVIYGINGIGKTMIFRILDCFYSADFGKLYELPFQKLILIFENNDILEGFGKLDHRYESLFFSYNNNLIKKIIGSKTEKTKTYQETIFKLIDKIPIHFISTERLIYYKQNGRNISKLVPKVAYNSLEFKSKDLSLLINNVNTEYLKLSEQLGLSLSKRVLKNQIRRDLKFDELLEIKNEVENRIQTLQEIGLMRTDFEVDFELNENLSKTDYTLIGASLMDFQLKLTVFDDLYNKLILFLEILNNRRLQYKTIAISEENGFEITNIKNQKLELTQLSTGEQHAIIMFYSLLFEVPENALVMIDEPENSLHIVWQKEFLNDIKDIIALRGFDVLIATHSPSIINGEWDLTVSLKGLETVAYA